MTYCERTKAVCASILLIVKNATIVIPVFEGIIYTIWDLFHSKKKEKDQDVKDAEFAVMQKVSTDMATNQKKN